MILSDEEAAQAQDLIERVNDAALQYRAALAEFNAFREEIHEAADSVYEAQPEAWQESSDGDAMQSFLESMARSRLSRFLCELQCRSSQWSLPS